MMDLCVAATLSTVWDNGALNRPASDSSLFRRSSARHLGVWSPVLRLLLWSYCGSATMLVSGGVSHSRRRMRSGLVEGHPQPSWRTRPPCTVDVLTGVTSSPG